MAVEMDRMSLHLPIQVKAACTHCGREGMISLCGWESDDTSIAVVANLAEINRDGFTLIDGLLYCKECSRDSNKHPSS
jgi:hypothetical protein